MKENQWKMKGKPIQTEKQKKIQKKTKKIPKKIRTLFTFLITLYPIMTQTLPSLIAASRTLGGYEPVVLGCNQHHGMRMEVWGSSFWGESPFSAASVGQRSELFFLSQEKKGHYLLDSL